MKVQFSAIAAAFFFCLLAVIGCQKSTKTQEAPFESAYFSARKVGEVWQLNSTVPNIDKMLHEGLPDIGFAPSSLMIENEYLPITFSSTPLSDCKDEDLLAGIGELLRICELAPDLPMQYSTKIKYILNNTGTCETQTLYHNRPLAVLALYYVHRLYWRDQELPSHNLLLTIPKLSPAEIAEMLPYYRRFSAKLQSVGGLWNAHHQNISPFSEMPASLSRLWMGEVWTKNQVNWDIKRCTDNDTDISKFFVD